MLHFLVATQKEINLFLRKFLQNLRIEFSQLAIEILILTHLTLKILI